MKAVQLTHVGRPLEDREVPVPDLGGRDVLVRVKAAGICHSDVHYRAGTSPAGPLPITLGHEVAGVVEDVGAEVRAYKAGDRVCLHYMVTCGECHHCSAGNEQFCVRGQMIGKHRDGGYAQYVAVPTRSLVSLPEGIPFEHGAVMMRSSATSYHALRKARLKATESIAVFGAGGLGMSAIQLAMALGAWEVYAVDISQDKLRLASNYGATAVDASEADPVDQIRHLTGGRGVDVALELIGLPVTQAQCVRCLAAFGRAVMVGITDQPFEINAYRDIIGREAEVIGCSDHLMQELPTVLEFARQGMLDLHSIVTRTVPLDAPEINEIMDDLEHFGGDVRTVIAPWREPQSPILERGRPTS
jgi:2-desacetyl-2-hydroxyethyl bacteriochlorophyllide A dehydrogenase